MFYPDDFCSDENVEAMSTEAVGAYILLLCKAWRSTPPCTLPSDDRLLARFARLSDDDWSVRRNEVLAAFTTAGEGRIIQRRLRKEYDKQRRKHLQRSESGRLGAQRRWQSYSNANGTAIAKESETESETSNSKKRNRAPPIPFPDSLNTDEFRQCWEDYRAYRAEIRKPFKPRGEKAALTRLAKEFTAEAAIAAIQFSMAQGWQGIFPEGTHKEANGRPKNAADLL